jgi:flavin-binding protein dodecin
MSVIRENFLPEFDYGDDAVLLTMDGAGVDAFRTAVSDAIQRGSSQLDHSGVTHVIQIQGGAADIDLEKTRVVWRLDLAKAREIDDDLEVSSRKGRAGHNYVDMSTSAPTLVLSRDEYVDVVYPWVAPISANPARLNGN